MSQWMQQRWIGWVLAVPMMLSSAPVAWSMPTSRHELATPGARQSQVGAELGQTLGQPQEGRGADQAAPAAGSAPSAGQATLPEPARVDLTQLPRGSVARLYDSATRSNSFALDGFPATPPGTTWQVRLREIIEQQGALDMTTNQTLLRQLVDTGALDGRIAELTREGRSDQEIYATLYTEVAQQAAAIFREVNRQFVAEGRVSQEASALITELDPLVAASRRIAEGFSEESAFVQVPNLGRRLGAFTKVPNIPVGPRAVELATRAGVDVNVTLVFGSRHYLDTAEGYVRGLEARVQDLRDRGLSEEAIGEDLSRIFSVNSLFVSRVDRAVDTLIDQRLRALEGDTSPEADATRGHLALLKGKTAVAQGQLVNRIFRAIFYGESLSDPLTLVPQAERERIASLQETFAQLRRQGANPQRLLMASTGVKSDQPYHPLLYTVPFFGPGMHNTLPEGTLAALSAFVGGLSDEEAAALRARSIISEPLPAIAQTAETKDAWLAAVRSGAGPRMTADEVLRSVQALVLTPLGQTLGAIADDLRDKGALAFAEDERKTVGTIAKRMESVNPGSGTTFIAVTAAGATITHPERIAIDKQVRGVIGAAFGGGRAVEIGPGTPALERQTQDAKLRERAQKANARLEQAAKAEGGKVEEQFLSRRRVLLATDDNPSLLSDEANNLHLIGSSGNYTPQGRSQVGSHYGKIALFELADEALAAGSADYPSSDDFHRAWVRHETAVLNAGTYVETPQDADILNRGFARIQSYAYTKRLNAIEKARERQLKQYTTDVYNVRLGGLLTATGIPAQATAAAEQVLAEAQTRGEIAGSWVLPATDDLQIQVNHAQGADNPRIQRLILEAGSAALRAAYAVGLTNARGTELASDNFASLGTDSVKRAAALGIRRESMSGLERGAEQVIVSKAIGAGVGAFNVPIIKALASIDNHPAGRIGRENFRFVVQRIDDIRQGKQDRVSYQFGPGEVPDMMVLVGDHSEWVITEVYAATGRFATGNPNEPVVKVVFEPVVAEGYTTAPANPTLIIRSQSGSEAVGVFTNALATPWVAPSGANDARHAVALPVPLSEANSAPREGLFKVVTYAYAQYGNGRIPDRQETIDVFNPRATAAAGLIPQLEAQGAPQELQTVFQLMQERAGEMASVLAAHGDIDPFLTARGAEAVADEAAEELAHLWEDIPLVERSVEEGGQPDALVERANQAAQGRTLSDIKADAGGKVGHTIPPLHYSLDAEASLALLKRNGTVTSYNHFSVGDDHHNVTVHTRGADDNTIHLRNYEIFWRMVWHATQLGFKWYGKGQDLVGEATAGKPEAALARIEQDFVDELASYLPAADMARHEEAIRNGFRLWQESGGGDLVEAPFSGNITGQGPGFAEVPLPATGAVRMGILASDKTGPAAFNIPIVAALMDDAVIERLTQAYGGVVVEVYNTKEHKRIFLGLSRLSAEQSRNSLRRLLANPDTYNVKRIWNVDYSRLSELDPRPPFDAREYIGDRILLSASTEKLSVITGGEYRGKDDSVMVGVPELMEPIFAFMRDHVYFTQGDGFGSHYNFPVPHPLNRAVATVHSRAVQVGLWVDVSATNELTFTDVYAGNEYRNARRRGEEVNLLFWNAQGSEVSPVGVGAGRVEQAYPLMKSLKAITAADSKYARPIHVDAAASVAQAQWAGQFEATGARASAKAVRAAHDTKDAKTIVLHESFFAQGPDAAIAIQRVLSDLGFVSADEAAAKGAITLQVVMAGAADEAAATERLSRLIAAVNAGSQGAASLKPEWFTVTTQTPVEQQRAFDEAQAPLKAAEEDVAAKTQAVEQAGTALSEVDNATQHAEWEARAKAHEQAQTALMRAKMEQDRVAAQMPQVPQPRVAAAIGPREWLSAALPEAIGDPAVDPVRVVFETPSVEAPGSAREIQAARRRQEQAQLTLSVAREGLTRLLRSRSAGGDFFVSEESKKALDAQIALAEVAVNEAQRELRRAYGRVLEVSSPRRTAGVAGVRSAAAAFNAALEAIAQPDRKLPTEAARVLDVEFEAGMIIPTVQPVAEESRAGLAEYQRTVGDV